MRRMRAYTLIEVLIVVAILGLASAIVVPSMLSGGTLGVQAAVRMLVADMLYAQNDAIAKQRIRRVVFEVADDRYRLTDESDQVIDVDWRMGGGVNYEVDFTSDSRFSGVRLVKAEFGEGSVLEFDDLGSPAVGGFVEIEFNRTRYRVNVAEFTGRVTVEKLAGG